jgi:hypothetical protein
MEPCKVVFESLEWKALMPGVRFKIFGDDVQFGQGSGIFIPTGASTRHKARSITPTIQLFLVEDV